MGLRHRIEHVGFAIIWAYCAGCAVRTLAPPVPAPAVEHTDLSPLSFLLAECRVAGTTSRDKPRFVDGLCERFLDYVHVHTEFVRNERTHPRDHHEKLGKHALIGELHLHLVHEHQRTYVLDVLTLGVLAPWWGTTQIQGTLRVKDPSGNELFFHSVEAQVPYLAVFWSWMRRGYVSRAYQQGFHDVFSELSRQLSSALVAQRHELPWPPGYAYAREEPPAPRSPQKADEPEPDAVAGAPAHAFPLREGLTPPETHPVENSAPRAPAMAHAPVAEGPPQCPEGTVLVELWDAQTESTTPTCVAKEIQVPSTLRRILQALGGIEVAGFYGLARVASSIKAEDGQSLEVAAGTATQLGYRVQLYTAPEYTGWFVYPVLGFMSQTIDIADFRATLPQVEVAGAQDMAARCSNPTTAEPFPCDDPNVYTLRMRSGYVGARGGLQLAVGNQTVQGFGTAEVGVNAAEYRHLEATIGNHTAAASRWDAFRSMAAGFTVGMRFPKAHVAWRLLGEFEYFRNFAYAQPLEFRGPVGYNQDKQIYERPRTFVDSVGLMTWKLQLALAYLF